MSRTVTQDGVVLHLSHADQIPGRWVGQAEPLRQLLAAWMKLGDDDLPLHPRLLGHPGVGKTTLAVAGARALGREVYVLQATMDTRPEDLLVLPVIDVDRRIRYVASPLVTALLVGGVCILDEGNRMSEKSWASLASLLDDRRTVESSVAGVKLAAHPDFRLVATMNDDASTFEIPEYIDSRLQPKIWLDFPERDEERRILEQNLPFATAELLDYVADFLARAHAADARTSVRDGIHVARYAQKLLASGGGDEAGAESARACLSRAVEQIVGEEARRFLDE
jgi:MoxR-like ATPase